MTLTHSADCHDPVCPELHETTTLPVINAAVLGTAIAEHRQALFNSHSLAHVADTHLCFDDCADDIYARCLRLTGRS